MINYQRKQIATVFLAWMLLISTFLMPSTQPVQAEGKVQNAEEIIQNLSDEERNALKELNTQTGFIVQSGISQESDEPVDVIIEFKEDPAKVAVKKSMAKNSRSAVSLDKAEANVEESHNAFKEALQSIQSEKKIKDDTSELEITHEYRDALNGVSMTLPGTMIPSLVETGLIEHVWKNDTVTLDLPDEETYPIEPSMKDSVPQIEVDLLHEEGITGEGVKVGVVDTGIDYNHTDLENAYQGYRATDGEDPGEVDPNNIKGWDFIDDDADPMETTYSEWQESGNQEFDELGNSYYTAHGTHVSGTIAGQNDADNDHGVKGVAPDVDLFSYRVLGPYGTGSMDGVIAGIDKAVKDGMDVINLSLGTDENNASTPTSIAINNAVLSGVVAAVAAGNAGPDAYTVGSPGTAPFAITVGASDVSQSIPTYSATAGEESFTDIELLGKNFSDSVEDLQGESYDIIQAGLGLPEDFEDIDVKGKIALIERGDNPFAEKMENAQEAGAALAIIYNNEEGQIPHYIGESSDFTTAFRVSDVDGEALIAAAEAETKLTFDDLSHIETEGDHLAEFSSRGPVNSTFDIKPDVTAPGVAIYSTVPFYINDPEGSSYNSAYARMQGTSMASPHVAGAAALVLEANEDYDPFEVKAALMNNAVELQDEHSVYEIGSGRINVYDAVHASTMVTVIDETDMLIGDDVVTFENITASLSYGSHHADGEVISETKNIAITNNSDTKQTYQTDVQFLSADDTRKDAGDNGVTFSIDDAITVTSEDTVEIEAEMKVPTDAEFGTYEGNVLITNDTEEVYTIPFAIRLSEKGIDYINFDRPAAPNEWTNHAFLDPFISAFFRMKSPMETVDVIVRDQKTNEAIGFIGQIRDVEANKEFIVLQAFNGYVQPFTGDPDNPIAEESVKLDEGSYIYEMIGTDKDGETYTHDKPVIVDNTPPEMTFDDYEPGIVEVNDSMYTDEDDHHALWIHTHVYDNTIDRLNELGYDFNQSENIVGYFQNTPFPGMLPVDEEGAMKFGLLPEELEAGPVTLELMPVDLATNANRYVPNYYFIQEGEPYNFHTYDKDVMYLGDKVTMTISLKHVKDLLSGEFSVEYFDDLYKFNNVSINEEFQRYADENDLDIILDEPSLIDEDFSSFVTVGAKLEGAESFDGISGDMDFLDVTFELISDQVFGGKLSLNVNDFKYTNTKDETIDIPSFTTDRFEIVAKASTVNGFISPEAFFHEEGGYPLMMDYEALGAKVYAQSQDGEKYPGTIMDDGSFTIESIPLSDEPYDIYSEIPGHLTVKATTTLGQYEDDELVGETIRLDPGMNAAGDVTGDGVIDIMDMMRIVGLYKTENKDADLNLDGIVDETDVRYIEENFMRVGADANGKQPIEKLGPKTLTDLLQAIDLEPVEDE